MKITATKIINRALEREAERNSVHIFTEGWKGKSGGRSTLGLKKSIYMLRHWGG